MTNKTSAYNLLWVAPRVMPRVQPIRDKTLENILHIASQNRSTDVRLWVDSKRLTPKQKKWVEARVIGPNLRPLDLRSIPEYVAEPLYQRPDLNGAWRSGYDSIIWKQVDAARILAALQGDYQQSFYSDADITNLKVNSEEVQKRMRTFGMLLGCTEYHSFENQLFAFAKEKRELFKKLYLATLRSIKQENKDNGFLEFRRFFYSEEARKNDNLFVAKYDGSQAGFK
ncbi:hypothetical protein KA107_03710 [Candidatus Pacearchaeota archaeon]|nr:hypothetical protein [Candidatus Pacearchaeota archaeon]